MNVLLDVIDTPRMIGRRLTPDHLAPLLNMHRNERFMANLGGLKNDEQTHAYLQENLTHWDRHGFGLWMFYDRLSGELLGRGYLRSKHDDGTDEPVIGYALLESYWGRGLATEIAGRIVGIGIETIGMHELYAATLPHNLASRRVLEKVGFAFDENVVYKNLPHARYRLTRDAWMTDQNE